MTASSEAEATEQMRQEIAETRANLSGTIEELHGRLNPVVFKEQVVEQFHQATERIKTELIAAKDAMKGEITVELRETKANLKTALKAELAEAKELAREEMSSGLEHAKEVVKTELQLAKEAVKDELASTVVHAKAALKAELGEAKDLIKSELAKELHETKTKLKDEIREVKEMARVAITDELHQARDLVSNEITETQAAVREATIGRMEKMAHKVEGTAKQAGSSIVQTIKRNPVPAAMVGIGIAWLVFGARRETSTKRRFLSNGPNQGRYGNEQAQVDNPVKRVTRELGATASNAAHAIEDGATAHSAGDKISHLVEGVENAVGTAAHKTGDTISRLAHDAQDAVGSATRTVSDKVMGLAHDAQAKAGQVSEQMVHLAHDTQAVVGHATEAITHLAHDAQTRGRHVAERAEEMYHDNPLAVGAVVLALGTAVGLAIPITSREDEWMGEARDEVLNQAQELTHGALGKVEDVARLVSEDAATGLQRSERNRRVFS